MVRIAAVSLTGLLLAACEPVAEPTRPTAPPAPAADPRWQAEVNRYLSVNVQPADPLEAVMWRGVRCEYLGSEIGGDHSAQDRAIQARMEELGCGEPMLAAARTLRERHAANTATIVRLDTLLSRLED